MRNIKSLNAKITLILICSFIFQIILIGSAYRLVVARNILSDLNSRESSRQLILQTALTDIQKSESLNKNQTIQDTLNAYKKSYSVNFVVKDIDGNVIYKTNNINSNGHDIQEIGFIYSSGRVNYIVYSYFPVKLKSIYFDFENNNTKFSIILIVVFTSLITLFFIYQILVSPLKKLRIAVEEVKYGNTKIKIPYYAEDEIGVLCRKFEEMGDRLKKSEDNQTQLIQAVSHDLKTPLTSIIGYIKRLDEGKINDDEKRKEYYSIIFRKALDIKTMIEELDEYSKFNTEEKYNIQKIDIRTFMEDVIRDSDYEVKNNGGSFVSKLIKVEGFMDGDRDKIKRVFFNIICNSLKYAGESCVISLKAECNGSKIFIKICDNGPGVPDDKLLEIFDRFFRLDVSRSRQKEGTGLGLSICKEIIEKHGGHISAENLKPNGLCIIFDLPINSTK